MRVLTPLVAAALIGCIGPRVPVLDVASLRPEEIVAVQRVRIILAGDLPELGGDATLIGLRKAYSCKHDFWEPPASRENALDQLRYLTFQAGGNAVVDVEVYTRAGDVLQNNCWQTVYATGTAIRIDSAESHEKLDTEPMPIVGVAVIAPLEQVDRVCSARMNAVMLEIEERELSTLRERQPRIGKQALEIVTRNGLRRMESAGAIEWEGCLAEHGWKLVPREPE